MTHPFLFAVRTASVVRTTVGATWLVSEWFWKLIVSPTRLVSHRLLLQEVTDRCPESQIDSSGAAIHVCDELQDCVIDHGCFRRSSHHRTVVAVRLCQRFHCCGCRHGPCHDRLRLSLLRL